MISAFCWSFTFSNNFHILPAFPRLQITCIYFDLFPPFPPFLFYYSVLQFSQPSNACISALPLGFITWFTSFCGPAVWHVLLMWPSFHSSWWNESQGNACSSITSILSIWDSYRKVLKSVIMHTDGTWYWRCPTVSKNSPPWNRISWRGAIVCKCKTVQAYTEEKTGACETRSRRQDTKRKTSKEMFIIVTFIALDKLLYWILYAHEYVMHPKYKVQKTLCMWNMQVRVLSMHVM